MVPNISAALCGILNFIHFYIQVTAACNMYGQSTYTEKYGSSHEAVPQLVANKRYYHTYKAQLTLSLLTATSSA